MTDAAVQEREDAPAAPPNAETSMTPRPEAPVTRTGAMGFGLVPSTIDEAWRLAGLLAKSTMVPKNYLGKPEDILVAMLYGNDIGLPPMAALQSVATINGKPGVYGDGFLGVIQSKPAYAKHKEFYLLSDGTEVKSLREEDYKNDETKAVSMFWRKGNPEPFVEEFSIGAAKRAKLWGKEGPWSQYPARQLMWRARGFAGRNGFAAELRGIKIAEELLDTADEVIVETIASAPPPEPQRRSEKAAGGTETAAADAPPTNQVEPKPGGDNGAASKPAGAGKTAAAEKAKPEEFKQLGPGQVMRNVRITNTSVVDKTKQGEGLHYEIEGNTGEAGQVRPTLTWVTKNEELYRAAASCEGSDSRFNVTFHNAKSKDGKKELKVITGLEGN